VTSFVTGGIDMCVHFIGFRTDHEYQSAIKVFGKPDFVHKWHDRRAYGDIDTDNDTVVFASKARPDVINKYSWQDHENN